MEIAARSAARRDQETGATRVGAFEQIPKWLNCVPLVAQWLWLGLRYRSFTLPTCVNPGITAGGLVGEGKLEYFNRMGDVAREATAPWAGFEKIGTDLMARARSVIEAAALAFPLIAKPDIGWCGYGVRRLADLADLARYLDAFPDGQTIVFQRLIELPGEAGAFYVRKPGEARGRLYGLALRVTPSVTGDGRSSLCELIAADSRLARGLKNPYHELAVDLAEVPPAGRIIRLSTVASTRVGGAYFDASDHLTDALNQRIDAIARDIAGFQIGRFDLRYGSLDALLRGEDFSIIEVNGVGSEAIHAWDPAYGIADVYRMIFAKQRLIFALGDDMRRRGARPVSVRELGALHFGQQKLIDRYPKSN